MSKTGTYSSFHFFSVFETVFLPVSDIVIVTCIKSSRTVTFDTNACISKKNALSHPVFYFYKSKP